MNELLTSLKADLSSRRMLPLVGLAVVALIAALAYVALASKSGSSTAPRIPASPVTSVAPLPGPPVASAPANPNAALSETTVGAGYQHGGNMHNPFSPLPGSGESQQGSSSASSASSSSSASGGSGSAGSSNGAGESSGGEGSGSAGGGSSSSGGSTEASKAGSGSSPAPVTLYHATAKLEQISETGEPVGKPQVFSDLKPLQPLPSKHDAKLVAVGAIHEGKQFVFVLAQEAILHGSASCLPGPAHCEAIALGIGHSEELQYLTASDTVVTYKLTVVKIEKATASAAKAKAASRVSPAGKALMTNRQLSLPSGISLLPTG